MLVRAVSIPPPPSQPPRRKFVKKQQVKRAIEHAQLLCLNFEDTAECRVAWDTVEELSRAYSNQKERATDDDDDDDA